MTPPLEANKMESEYPSPAFGRQLAPPCMGMGSMEVILPLTGPSSDLFIEMVSAVVPVYSR
jgi:hypothetical protein